MGRRKRLSLDPGQFGERSNVFRLNISAGTLEERLASCEFPEVHPSLTSENFPGAVVEYAYEADYLVMCVGQNPSLDSCEWALKRVGCVPANLQELISASEYIKSGHGLELSIHAVAIQTLWEGPIPWDLLFGIWCPFLSSRMTIELTKLGWHRKEGRSLVVGEKVWVLGRRVK